MEVNWSFLPHSPELFFGLPESYTGKDLKRAYTKLIKSYKPERNPEEFTKIRSAYEELQTRLSYGVDQPRIPIEIEREPKRPIHDAPTTTQPYPRPVPRESESASQQLAGGTGLEEIAYRLQTKPYKTVDEFIQLAFIKDSLSHEDNNVFFDVIIEGLQANPANQKLISCLFEYLKQPIDVKHIAEVLDRCHFVLELDKFFYTTETLWLKYFQVCEEKLFFEKFHTLSDFDGFESSSGSLVFLLRFLQKNLFKISEQRIGYYINILYDRFDELPGTEDLALLSTLFEYRLLSEDFLSNKANEIHLELDAAIKAFCELPIQESLNVFLSVAVKFQDSQNIYAVFQRMDPASHAAASAFQILAKQMEFELGIESESLDEQGFAQLVFDSFERLEAISNKHKAAFVGQVMLVKFCFSSYLLIQSSIYLSNLCYELFAWTPSVLWQKILIPSLLTAGFLYPYVKWIHPIISSLDFGFVKRTEMKAYVEIWRPEILLIMERSQCSVQNILEMKDALIANKAMKRGAYKDYAMKYAQNDISLLVQSAASRLR